ncbi:MAG: hydrolase [Planctomycetes bacterium RBG_16_64_10]|nr:MAG: hydrolase [Planctomycetes bacterium RBG_16_64_10]
MVLLGTGTSVGVPTIGCDCAVCRSSNPKNQRTRCGAACGLPHGNLLVDTPTDLRAQLLREGIGLVHAVLYTHEHADHVFGLDDLRLFPIYLGGPVPLYGEPGVRARILRSFDYAFNPPAHIHVGGVPRLEFHTISTQPFNVLGARVIPIRLAHARHVDVLGFRIGNVAYCTDTNGIPAASRALLKGLDVLVLDALRSRPHATHFSLDEAVAVARELRPRRTLFTHLSHELEHEATCARLPTGMELAYDGLRIPLT